MVPHPYGWPEPGGPSCWDGAAAARLAHGNLPRHFPTLRPIELLLQRADTQVSEQLLQVVVSVSARQ